MNYAFRVTLKTQLILIDQEPDLPPQARGSCEPLLLWRVVKVVLFCCFSLADHTERSGPLTQGRVPIRIVFEVTEIRQRGCPPQGAGIFAYFCCRTKVWRRAGRDPPVLILAFKSENPGVAPPDCALLFCWPKRVSRKGPALRWACLARQGGNLNSGQTIRRGIYISPAGDEALESLSCRGELQRSSCSPSFSL